MWPVQSFLRLQIAEWVRSLLQPLENPATFVLGSWRSKSVHHFRDNQLRDSYEEGLKVAGCAHFQVDEIQGKASVRPVNHPSFRPTRSPLWSVVHTGQCGPKIVGIGSFCSHGDNPARYRKSWAVQQSSLKAATFDTPHSSTQGINDE